MKIVAITDDQGAIVEAKWLEKAERVHRQLRPHLPAAYAARLREIFDNGARMTVVAEDGEGDEVVSVALWRIIENTYEGRRLYVDDLVSDEAKRSQGAGKLLLDWLADKAKTLTCDMLALDSGVQRQGAHRFYFREGMHVASFSFKKALK
ncbi:N-acetyltransferase GCN5 [Betaproteobacteria bacterium]|nr:N-acetyltransferase GCN5 [Betaproteobacteria bacterium]